MDVPYFIKEPLWMSSSDEAMFKKILCVEVNPPSKLTLKNKMVPQLWLL